jgi:hypothetical protein
MFESDRDIVMKGTSGDHSTELTSRAGSLWIFLSFLVGDSSAPHGLDSGFDFPPAAHPRRELFTASLFVLLVMIFAVWGGWKLTSLVTSLV